MKAVGTVILSLMFSIAAQTPPTAFADDTLTVRAILDANGLDTVPALTVVDTAGGRVTRLTLSSLELTTLPDTIGSLTALRELNVHSNRLDSLPESIGRLTQLRDLIAGSNNITSLPESIGACDSLSFIFLDRNDIDSLPSSIGNLAVLEQLRINHNNLREITPSLKECGSLLFLYLEHNSLETFPEVVLELDSLYSLHLAGNSLDSLPEAIATLPNLSVVTLADNNFCEISDSLATWLETRADYWRPSQACPATADSIIVRAILDSNGLTDTRVEFVTTTVMGSVVEMNLSDLPITTIPSCISQLFSLEVLEMYDCSLSVLPPQVGSVRGLKELYLENNQLTTLPGAVCNLTNLEILYITSNQLESFPDDMGNMTSLKEIYADENALAALPWSLFIIDSLEYVDVTNNELTDLPSSLLSNSRVFLGIGGNHLCGISDTLNTYLQNSLGWSWQNDQECNNFARGPAASSPVNGKLIIGPQMNTAGTPVLTILGRLDAGDRIQLISTMGEVYRNFSPQRGHGFRYVFHLGNIAAGPYVVRVLRGATSVAQSRVLVW
ncbi:MAG: hypothetical protein GF350_01965 [Chitinivibrionales bacterium]|nr:hypothetical protein [Chitinivibrionales bacterium]